MGMVISFFTDVIDRLGSSWRMGQFTVFNLNYKH